MDIENNNKVKNIKFSILILNENSDDITLNLNTIANKNLTRFPCFHSLIFFLGGIIDTASSNLSTRYTLEIIFIKSLAKFSFPTLGCPTVIKTGSFSAK